MYVVYAGTVRNIVRISTYPDRGKGVCVCVFYVIHIWQNHIITFMILCCNPARVGCVCVFCRCWLMHFVPLIEWLHRCTHVERNLLKCCRQSIELYELWSCLRTCLGRQPAALIFPIRQDAFIIFVTDTGFVNSRCVVRSIVQHVLLCPHTVAPKASWARTHLSITTRMLRCIRDSRGMCDVIANTWAGWVLQIDVSVCLSSTLPSRWFVECSGPSAMIAQMCDDVFWKSIE